MEGMSHTVRLPLGSCMLAASTREKFKEETVPAFIRSVRSFPSRLACYLSFASLYYSKPKYFRCHSLILTSFIFQAYCNFCSLSTTIRATVEIRKQEREHQFSGIEDKAAAEFHRMFEFTHESCGRAQRVFQIGAATEGRVPQVSESGRLSRGRPIYTVRVCYRQMGFRPCS